MAINYASQFRVRRAVTPQSQPLPGRTDTALNNAGGYSFVMNDWDRLDRFLILGAEGGTYYVGERDLVKQNYDAIRRCIAEDGKRVVLRVAEISKAGRAPKNDPAIFALALVFTYGDADAKELASVMLREVCRIGTHLFHFCDYVSALRGWGHGLRNAVAHWYTDQEPLDLAYQVIKYQSRDKWSHRDCLRLAHPRATLPVTEAIFRWIVGGNDSLGARTVNRKGGGERKYKSVRGYLPEPIVAFEQAKAATKASEIVKLITDFNLPRECIPTQFLNDPSVWEALLQDMPVTAMIRNLGKMTSVGLVAPFSAAAKLVVERLGEVERLQRGRVHPLQMLIALKTYSQGHGEKGSLSWNPVPQVSQALDRGFYLSFKAVKPTGKNILYALDVSGSMSMGGVAGSSITPREASAAMALVLASTEPNYHIMAFSDRFMKLDIRPGMTLEEATRRVSNLPFAGTDCALPIIWAIQNKAHVDAFVTMTDNETWAGAVHPTQALASYRQSFVKDARNIVVGMTATEFTINDPNDALGLDVAGFDAALPVLIGDFIGGSLTEDIPPVKVTKPEKPSRARRKAKRATKRAS